MDTVWIRFHEIEVCNLHQKWLIQFLAKAFLHSLCGIPVKDQNKGHCKHSSLGSGCLTVMSACMKTELLPSHNMHLMHLMTSHQSCFLTAWPFKVSTLKLFVRAGIMKNAMTVTSLWLTCERKKLHKSMASHTELYHTVHWYHSTNTHLLEADSWVWPKLPRRGQHLC